MGWGGGCGVWGLLGVCVCVGCVEWVREDEVVGGGEEGGW